MELTSFLVFLCVATIGSASFDLCVKNENDPEVYENSSVQNCGCEANYCLRKCCKPGYYLGPKRVCVKNESDAVFQVPVYRELQTLKTESNISNFLVGILHCRYYLLDNYNPNDSYFAQENGYLLVPAFKQFYDNNAYCVDEKDGLSAFLCFDENEAADAGRKFNSVGMIISMPFLLATFLVYALLPDRNLHQKALMFYVLTLFVSYVLLVTINLSDSLVEPGCTLIGYLTLFFFMVSFFWMNVICLDIWFTFSGSRGFVGSKRSSERKRLLIYCGYAWGVPLLLTFTVLLIQTYSDPESQFNPAIGSTKCFLGDGLPNLLYFYGETAILIIINVTLFGLTAYKIRKVKKETSMLKQNDSKRHSYEKDKQKFNLFLKLLFAMGVNWSMEIISWAVNWSTGNTYTAVWYLTDFCNAAYGVFIFFIFVFKKKIWNLLQKRYYTFIGKPHLARTMTTTQSQTTRTSNYSSATYSTADTHIAPDRNNTNGTIPEEVALHRMR
ncbi:G-protein coupled receptor Mth2-like isoform X2 [Cylas formicarius]|uniref:G-protein coupled receptor Mth2-like isoform X2 n=1 Tax=Cylas formicarius TaxID=197179 RepID=UPI002958696D|nr:G-protein coupled receptor Mth2-like isoform X2 [Cylas formicarius]